MEIRACHSCKVYVTILDGFEGQKLIKNFDNDHRTHPRGTMVIEEAKNYTNVDEKYFKPS